MARKAMNRETLCWKCGRCTGFCPWSKWHDMQPVEGWTAMRRDVEYPNEKPKESYIVLACPLFVPDGRDHEQGRHTKRTWTAEQKRQVMELLRDGMTYKECAALMGRTPGSVAYWVSCIRKESLREIHDSRDAAGAERTD